MSFIFSGESHMDALVAVVEGFPAGFPVDIGRINRDLARRQAGYGRGNRMKIEADKVSIYSGIINGVTIGSPITLVIPNKDNRRDTWGQGKKQTVPRPGHADLAGYLKYGFDDLRLIAERASARQTAAWVAAGSLVMQFLERFNIRILGFVRKIASLDMISPVDPFMVMDEIEKSPLRVMNPNQEKAARELIDKAAAEGETLGGVVTVIARGVPAGLGSYAQIDKKLDAKLAGAFMAVPSVKAVEIGEGIRLSELPGSFSVDTILNEQGVITRPTNRAGGIEGGVSNGQDIIVHAACKPVPTVKMPVKSLDVLTLEEANSPYVRSDVCVVPAISVIGESIMAQVLFGAFLEKFGADTFGEIQKHFKLHKDRIKEIMTRS